MANEDQAEEKPAQETQESPMPSEEQTTPPLDEGGSEAQPEETAQAEPNELPEDVSERTSAQFEKLRRQLQEERQRREAIEGAYRSLNKPDAQDQYVPIIDPDTGLIDEDSLRQVQQQSQAALAEAQRIRDELSQAQRDREDAETFAAYPELNPQNKDSFDNKLHIATRQVMLDSMLNPQDYGNKQLSFKEAADLAKGGIGADSARAEGAKEALEQLTPKEQASLGTSSSSTRRSVVAGTQEAEELRIRSRKGDPDAVIARLNALDKQD